MSECACVRACVRAYVRACVYAKTVSLGIVDCLDLCSKKKIMAIVCVHLYHVSQPTEKPTPGVSSGCSKCGPDKSGKLSCCSRGGDWFKQCGKPGDKKYAHTWTEGVNACKGV